EGWTPQGKLAVSVPLRTVRNALHDQHRHVHRLGNRLKLTQRRGDFLKVREFPAASTTLCDMPFQFTYLVHGQLVINIGLYLFPFIITTHYAPLVLVFRCRYHMPLLSF